MDAYYVGGKDPLALFLFLDEGDGDREEKRRQWLEYINFLVYFCHLFFFPSISFHSKHTMLACAKNRTDITRLPILNLLVPNIHNNFAISILC